MAEVILQTLLWTLLVLMSLGVAVAVKVIFSLRKLEAHLENIDQSMKQEIAPIFTNVLVPVIKEIVPVMKRMAK